MVFNKTFALIIRYGDLWLYSTGFCIAWWLCNRSAEHNSFQPVEMNKCIFSGSICCTYVLIHFCSFATSTRPSWIVWRKKWHPPNFGSEDFFKTWHKYQCHSQEQDNCWHLKRTDISKRLWYDYCKLQMNICQRFSFSAIPTWKWALKFWHLYFELFTAAILSDPCCQLFDLLCGSKEIQLYLS